MSLQDIAKSFLLSDEAMILDVYHQQYGRMAEDEGLNYWQQSNEASASGISDEGVFAKYMDLFPRDYPGWDNDPTGLGELGQKP